MSQHRTRNLQLSWQERVDSHSVVTIKHCFPENRPQGEAISIKPGNDKLVEVGCGPHTRPEPADIRVRDCLISYTPSLSDPPQAPDSSCLDVGWSERPASGADIHQHLNDISDALTHFSTNIPG